MGDNERAGQYCQRSIEIAERIDYHWGVGRAAITLGNVESAKYNHREALAWYQKALQVTSQIGDRQGLGWVIANMASLYVMWGDYARALRCDQYSLHNALEIGDKWTTSICLANMAEYLSEMDQSERAEMLYQKAIALGRALDLNFLPAYLANLATFYAGQHRFQEAMTLNDEALILVDRAGLEQMGGEDLLFGARILAIRLHLEQDQSGQAEAVAELQAMLSTAQDEGQKARLGYEIWRMDPEMEAHRQAAASRYRALYAKMPNHEFGQRFLELTGERLPTPPPLPDPPEMVQQQTDLDLDAMLAEVDEILASLVDKPVSDWIGVHSQKSS